MEMIFSFLTFHTEAQLSMPGQSESLSTETSDSWGFAGQEGMARDGCSRSPHPLSPACWSHAAASAGPSRVLGRPPGRGASQPGASEVVWQQRLRQGRVNCLQLPELWLLLLGG